VAIIEKCRYALSIPSGGEDEIIRIVAINIARLDL
jgi:hypothetical protein